MRPITLIIALKLLCSTIANSQTEKTYNSLRLGLGYQGTLMTEIGFSHLIITDKGQFGGSYCFFGSVEGNYLHGQTPVYAVKVGYEGVWTIFLGGLEAKYLSNFENGTVMFTPKIGLSPWGVISLCYGYNLMTPENPFPYIYNNQLSLTVNLSKKLAIEIFGRQED